MTNTSSSTMNDAGVGYNADSDDLQSTRDLECSNEYAAVHITFVFKNSFLIIFSVDEFENIVLCTDNPEMNIKNLMQSREIRNLSLLSVIYYILILISSDHLQ